LHFNLDHPHKDDVNWLKDTIVARNPGEDAVSTVPIKQVDTV